MKKATKRLTALLLSALLFFTPVLSASAAENDG